jgi:hypothetical protein
VRRNPLTLLFGLQLILVFQTYVEDGYTQLAFMAAAVVGLAMGMLCARDLRNRGVPRAWQYGALVFLMPLLGFIAYVRMRGQASSARPTAP